MSLRYGFAPYRPVLILGLWALVSAAIFANAYYEQTIVRVESGSASKSTILFNSILFAVDTLVPIVDFNQKIVVPTSQAEPNFPIGPNADWWTAIVSAWKALPNTCVRWLIVFNTFFGWTMTTLFAASVTGLLRRAKDY
jgi:hypothetical protein